MFRCLSVPPVFGLLFCCLWGVASLPARLPDWAAEAARATHPAYHRDVGAVFLLDEMTTEVRANGRVRSHYRGVVKILRPDHRAEAEGRVIYNSASDKVSKLEAWMLQPDDKVETYRPRDAIDEERAGAGSIYSEMRQRTLSGASDVRAGSIFAWEYVLERGLTFAQDVWALRGPMPMVRSRYTLKLPAGWSARATALNGAEFTPRQSGSTWEWEARDVPPVIAQAWSPPAGTFYTGIGIDFEAPPEARSTFLSFGSWAEVARYQNDLADPAMQPDATVRAQARALLVEANAGEHTWEGIQAMARFTQAMNYVAVSIDLRNGGGYRPFPAPTILARRYGDCKDKTTLMRSLLESLGIETFSVGVKLGRGMRVDPSWPSLYPFDHMILALRPPAELESPAVVDVPGVGRLLFFDPTDPDTPIGDLPTAIQDSWAILDTPVATELVRLPGLPASLHRRVEVATATVSASGALAGTIETRRFGQEARPTRADYRRLNEREWRQSLLRLLHADLPTAQLGEIEVEDAFNAGELRTQIGFSHPSYARSIAGRILVLKPIFWGRRDWLPVDESIQDRINPVRVSTHAFEQEIKLTLPEGFVIDERGSDLELSEDFGTYHLRQHYAEETRTLTIARRLITRPHLLPPEDYSRVRAFFKAIQEAENTPMVLSRQ